MSWGERIFLVLFYVAIIAAMGGLMWWGGAFD